MLPETLPAEISDGGSRWAFGGEGACFLETGFGRAAYIKGNFFAEPEPELQMRKPSMLWRWVKEGFVRTWLWRWF